MFEIADESGVIAQTSCVDDAMALVKTIPGWRTIRRVGDGRLIGYRWRAESALRPEIEAIAREHEARHGR